MKHSEEGEQKALFDWAQYVPACRWLFAVPNGGNRNPREAARLKAGGVKAGVSDVFLPVPTESTEELSDTGYHGLFIEMKRRKVDGTSRVSDDQKAFQDAMVSAGYKCAVCYGAEEAIEVIRKYLGLAV